MLISTLMAAVATAALSVAAMDPHQLPAHISAAVMDETRPENDSARDEGRKPGHILEFAEIEPGQRVADLTSGGGYYTRMLQVAVGANGHVFAHNPPYVAENYPQAIEGMSAYAGEHENVSSFVSAIAELDQAEALAGEPLDTVMMVLYYHDLLLQDVDRAAINQAIFDSLKPGGVFLVIDHQGADDIDLAGVESLHRMAENQAIEEITAAGFVLEASSDVLANAEDDRTQGVFSEGLRGRTDRFVHKYRKPM